MQLLQFCRDINSNFIQICEPLLNNFPIQNFCYTRYFNNYDLISICSDLRWSEKYAIQPINCSALENHIRETNLLKTVNPFFATTKNCQEPLMDMLYEHGISNFLNFHVAEKDTVHAWSFCIKDSINHPHDYFFRNLSTLWEASKYFLDLFDRAYDPEVLLKNKGVLKNSIQVFDGQIPHTQDNSLDRMLSSKMYESKMVRLFYNSQSFFISRSNFDLLNHMAKGYSNKQISSLLSRSEKTIDKRIMKLKNDLGVFSKDKLIEVYSQNSLTII